MGIGKYQVHLRVVPRHHLLVCIPAATDHASDIATQPRIVLDQVLAIECESRVQYHDVRLGTPVLRKLGQVKRQKVLDLNGPLTYTEYQCEQNAGSDIGPCPTVCKDTRCVSSYFLGSGLQVAWAEYRCGGK